MKCPHCRSRTPKKARFCHSCGNQIATACSQCQRRVSARFHFCIYCGHALSADASAPAPAAVAKDSSVKLRRLESTRGEEKPGEPPATATNARAGTNLERFIPQELLSKLSAIRASGKMIGERRIVTMLFCDVKDSTAAAERLDPEEWSEIMNGTFEHLIRPIYRYEGTVARLMGDGLLAFFGAPIAHEDDPQRAVLAGLDITDEIRPYADQVRQRWNLDLNVRIGINTGLVVVGAVGSDLRMEYTAMGDAINLAARLEQSAQPGTVRISESTHRLVAPLFEIEALGGVEVKGKREPVQVFRVLGRKARPKRSRGVEGLHAEMVGRQAELLALRGVMTDLKQGVGRIVNVLGEAGVGKSRLVSEGRRIFESLDGPPGNWYEVGTLSYETNEPYGLLKRVIRTVTGMTYNDPEPVIRDCLATLVQTLKPERRPHAQQLCEALFGLSGGSAALILEGEGFRQELLQTVAEWWRVRFATEPTVLVFDDMHWSDTASVKLLRHLLPLTEEISLVLMGVLRVEREAPAWQIKVAADEEYRHRHTEIMLRPLSAEESNELLNRLLNNPELPAPLRAAILEKTGGNPFFIEEVVRALIDVAAVVPDEDDAADTERTWRATSEGADFDIPDNLQVLLAARLDRLEDGTRGTLQVASVIGRSFYHRLLEAVDEASVELDEHLGTLLRLDMIREAARLPEIEYAFRNPLTQEAVYKSILLKRRREFHRRIGEAIESLYGDRLDALAGLLARHFTLADLRDKAIGYYRKAANRALALYAYEDALHNLDAALELLKGTVASETRLALTEERGDVYRYMRNNESAIVQYREAVDLWQELVQADSMIEVRLHRKIVQVVNDLKWTVAIDSLKATLASRLESRARLEANLSLLDSGAPHPEMVRVLVVLSHDSWRIENPPDWEAAQRYAEDAVAWAQRLESPAELSRALGALANVLDGRSMLREHLQVAEQRLVLCREPEFDDLREQLDALRTIGGAHLNVGEFEQAMNYLHEAESLAIRVHAVDQEVNALGLQSQCLFRLDKWDEMLRVESRWRDLERRYPRHRVGETCFFVALSATVHGLRGNTEQARAYAQESYDYMLAATGNPDEWPRNAFY